LGDGATLCVAERFLNMYIYIYTPLYTGKYYMYIFALFIICTYTHHYILYIIPGKLRLGTLIQMVYILILEELEGHCED